MGIAQNSSRGSNFFQNRFEMCLPALLPMTVVLFYDANGVAIQYAPLPKGDPFRKPPTDRPESVSVEHPMTV
jgi:hypothetical protein